MKSYFPEAIKQRRKSHLTPNIMSVLSRKKTIKSSVKMQWERRKRKTEDSELHSKTQNKSGGWRRQVLVRECCGRNLGCLGQTGLVSIQTGLFYIQISRSPSPSLEYVSFRGRSTVTWAVTPHGPAGRLAAGCAFHRSSHTAPTPSHRQRLCARPGRGAGNTGSGSHCLALGSRHSGSPRQMLGAYAMN